MDINKLIIINMDTFQKYVNARVESMETEIERLTEENKELKLFILRNDLNKSKVFPKLFYK
mgnify:FL=1